MESDNRLGLHSPQHLMFLLAVFFFVAAPRHTQALTCTQATDFTCQKSIYVTGKCVDGVCECVNGTVPNNYGCHERFTPTVSVDYPYGWSGEIHPDGYIVLYCNPKNFERGEYIWYKNGTLIEGEEYDSTVARNPQEPQEFQCMIKAYGGLSELSEPFAFAVGGMTEKFKVKPIVVGMIKNVAVNATITLYCEQIPASYTWHLWYIDGEKLKPDWLSRSVTFNMTADRFNKSVMCVVDHRNSALNIASDPVMTPEAPVEDIPGVVVQGERELYVKGMISLSCEISQSFVKSSDDTITYGWWKNEGKQIAGATSQTLYIYSLTKEDAGIYTCTASYNGQPAKESPLFVVEVLDALPLVPSMTHWPQKALLGGYVAIKCGISGPYDPMALTYKWERFKGRVEPVSMNYYTDNIIQFNDLQKTDLRGMFMCQAKKGTPTVFSLIFRVDEMSEQIQPVIVEGNFTSSTFAYILSCESLYEKTPGLEFEWYVDGILDEDSTYHHLGLNAKINAQNVTCRMSFRSNSSSLSDIFVIPANGKIASPVIEVEGYPSSFIKGFSYTLICASVSHNASAMYTWRKGGVDLNINLRSLTLSNIQSSDDGNYTCTITFGEQSEMSQKTLELIISSTFEAPVIQVPGQPSAFIAGETYSLLCASASDLEEKVSTYNWTKEGVSLGDNSNSVVFQNIQPQSNGNYSCSITIGDVTVPSESHFNLVVTTNPLPPVIVSMKNPEKFILGGSYNLQCLAASESSTASYRWSKDSVDLKVFDPILVLQNIQASDKGNYSCFITVAGMSTQADQHLEVIITEEGKYCTSASDCQGKGFNQTHCDRLKCQCLSDYRMEDKECIGLSSGTHAQICWALTLNLIACVILVFNKV